MFIYLFPSAAPFRSRNGKSILAALHNQLGNLLSKPRGEEINTVRNREMDAETDFVGHLNLSRFPRQENRFTRTQAEHSTNNCGCRPSDRAEQH